MAEDPGSVLSEHPPARPGSGEAYETSSEVKISGSNNSVTMLEVLVLRSWTTVCPSRTIANPAGWPTGETDTCRSITNQGRLNSRTSTARQPGTTRVTIEIKGSSGLAKTSELLHDTVRAVFFFHFQRLLPGFRLWNNFFFL